MKKIKLIFAVLLSFVGVLSFAGCSKDNNSDKVKELEETIRDYLIHMIMVEN